MKKFNSSINIPKGNCKDCPEDAPEKFLIGGRCGYHYKIHLSGKPTKEKERKKQEVLHRALSKWFSERRGEMTGICENCGGPTSRDHPLYWKFCIAHVLPKRKDHGFPSIATHPKNWMELCYFGGCHATYDSAWSKAARMPVFEVAKQRFLLMQDDIAEGERGRIPEVFLNQE